MPTATPYNPISPLDILPSFSWHTATVDLRVGPDGELVVQWTETPGQLPRSVPATAVQRLLAVMKAVHDAEQTRSTARIQPAWHAASEALLDLLDGPERALYRRIDEAEGRDLRLLVTVRALADHHDVLRTHPVTRMLWQLLPVADTQRSGRIRLAAVLQLGARDPGAPLPLSYAGLRILSMAFSPQDVQPELDFEGEEERFLAVLAPFVSDGRASVRVVEDGTLEDLARALLVDTYDVVHLTGHGVMTPQGPRLVMEDETGMRRRKDGKPADVSPMELIEVLRRSARMPPIVVLSNCHSAESREATPSFVVELVASGVPVVIGWTQSVRDDQATDASSDIYQQLAAGKPVVDAVELARDLLRQREKSEPRPGHAWATLALVTCAGAGMGIDRSAAPLPVVVDTGETYRFLAGGHMKVLQRGFVGRRRPLQRLVRVLRDGKFADAGVESRDIAAVVVWGMKGAGKSCLVARAVERVRQHHPKLGMVVLYGALDDMAVLAGFQQLAIDQWEDHEAEQILTHKDLPVLQRVRRVLARWRARPIAVILDDFEQNLEARSDGPWRLRSHAADVLDVLIRACKLGKARLMITTTAMFEVAAAHAAAIGELRLGTLEPASIRKLWMRGPRAGGHIEVGLRQWEQLAQRLGNNARILSWARDLLAGKTSGELAEVAARAEMEVPAWLPGDEVRPEKRDELARLFLRHMAYEETKATVGGDALVFLQRARVFEVAVPAEALAGLAEGLAIDLGRDLVVLANRGLLEVGELDGQRAYRVSPLVEPVFAVERPELWHGFASRFWWEVADAGKGAAQQLERVTYAWRHALAGRHSELAERAGLIIDGALFQAGLYAENRRRAEEHHTSLPGDPFGAQWAGKAEYYAVGPTPRARERLETAFHGLVEMHGTDRHPNVATNLHALGGLLRAQGDLTEARAVLERSLAIYTEVHGTDSHPSVAVSLHALGGVLQAQGDLTGARAALERALAIDAEVHGTDSHPAIAASLHALGGVLQAQGDLAGARAALERSLAIDVEVHGTDSHPTVAASLHALGGVLQAQGDLAGARAALERSLAIKAKVHGTDSHPDVAATLHGLGEVLEAQGDLAGARAALERAFAISVEIHGTDRHPAVAATLHTLGRVLKAQGDLVGARAALERALAILAEVHGTDRHPSVATSLHALGEVFLEQGELAGARAALERVLDIDAKVHGTDRHPEVAASLRVLGGVMEAQGDLAGARAALERSLEILAEVHGTDRHPSIAASLHALAGVCLAEGNPQDAVLLYRRVLAIEMECFGTLDQYHSAETEVLLAMVLSKLNQRQEADELLRHAVPLLAAANPNHPVVRRLATLVGRG